MSSSLKELETRVQALEKDMIPPAKLKEIIDLLDDMKGAFHIIVKIGNGLKWVAIIVTALTGAYAAVRKWI